jgi:cyclohexanone monooxygenase
MADDLNNTSPRPDFDVVIVGAGWSGMYMLHQCRQLGLKAHILEAGPAVGGTWYWNRYPGLRCDVESVQYSFSFDAALQQEWTWTERYATQPEILEYANHVAQRFDLLRDISFNSKVSAARFDDKAGIWNIETRQGRKVSGRFVVMATGCLTVPKDVVIPGMSDFKGEVYHTARWPQTPVDFSGKRVGVIGTGSSGIQAIPLIAEQAEHLYVFQRTPSYSLPAKNRELSPEYVANVKKNYETLRADARAHLVGIPAPTYAESVFDVSEEKRREIYASKYDNGLPFALMVAFGDLLVDEKANQTAQDYLAERIREKVKDPELAEQLIPKGQFVGTRRLCLDTNYYETFNRPNVTLKNIAKNPIDEITETGVRMGDELVEVDCLVYATGYDAMTGPLLAFEIEGKGGIKLKDAWAEGPKSLLGLMVNGFPNLFTITGPGSPSVLSNMFCSIEQHVEWVSRLLGHLQQQQATQVEAKADAQENWVAHVNEVANSTLFPRGATWYMGANIPGKPRVFMPYLGVGPYRQICDEVEKDGYRGFAIS